MTSRILHKHIYLHLDSNKYFAAVDQNDTYLDGPPLLCILGNLKDKNVYDQICSFFWLTKSKDNKKYDKVYNKLI